MRSNSEPHPEHGNSSPSSNVGLEAPSTWVDEGDNDMDFELETEENESSSIFRQTEESEDESQDTDASLSGIEVQVSLEEDEQEDEEGGERTPTRQSPVAQTLSPNPRILGARRLLQLLQRNGFRLRYDDDVEEDEPPRRHRSSGAKHSNVNKYPPVPSEEGRKLMDAGIFGTSRCYGDSLRRKDSRLADKLVYRELGLSRHNPVASASSVAQGLIPSSKADRIVHYSTRCYSGQFSDDGNFFFSCAQDFKVRMYDTSNPYDWKYYKTVIYPFGQWTITDATLSPDNRYLAYTSIRSTVCLSSTDPSNRAEPWLLDLSDDGEQGAGGWRHARRGFSNFGIWSIRFSGDGRELVAGTSAPSVCVYDIERRRYVENIEGAHSEDVNAVCFGDSSSPHILYSGSDDTLIKVWDRRSLGDGRAAGVFMGHTEGLTYVDSKGDGRYVLSNGKDQTMKLWDLRKMTPTENADKVNPRLYTTNFDYRFTSFRCSDYEPHPYDTSIVTYRGHSVLKTLIRCHFSPPGSTNSRYVYSGSEDGNVYIYNIDATLAGKIDVNEATRHSRPCDPAVINQYVSDDQRDGNAWKTCVRDASWHPNAPMIAATSWNGWGMSTGTCTTHSWNDGCEDDEGFPAIGQSVDQRLVPDRPEVEQALSELSQTEGHWRSRLRSARVPAHASNEGA